MKLSILYLSFHLYHFSRIMSFDTTAKNWEVFRHIFLLLPSLLTSHFNMIWRIKALLFLASLELEKQSQQNSSSSTCALSLLTYLLGFNNKYLKLIQSWKHLVRFVFVDFLLQLRNSIKYDYSFRNMKIHVLKHDHEK